MCLFSSRQTPSTRRKTTTHALLRASPAIDAGSNLLSFTFDQRGAPRVSGARADIGAFESVQAKPPDEIFADGFD